MTDIISVLLRIYKLGKIKVFYIDFKNKHSYNVQVAIFKRNN